MYPKTKPTVNTGQERQLALLCGAKFFRTFGFGCISVVLAVFLFQRGFSDAEVGAILTATLLEDAVVSSAVSLFADRFGFRTILLTASALIFAGGLLIAFVTAKTVILLAVILGIVSPAGYEGGPFAAIEQTLLAENLNSEKLTRAYSHYNLSGFAGAAFGALSAGICVNRFGHCYNGAFLLYAASGAALAVIYALVRIAPSLTRRTDIGVASRPLPPSRQRSTATPVMRAGKIAALRKVLPHSPVFWKFVSLQGLDAFGGGFVVQALISFWFYQRYHAGPELIGPLFFWCNVVAALSFTIAPVFVKRFGLLNTMVFTHLPCSVALGLVPLLPTAPLAAGLLLARSVFSSIDIPVRQAYTMLVVKDRERVAASAITTAVRSITQALGPMLSSLTMVGPVACAGLPFFIAGACKSTYDVGLYLSFKHLAVEADPVEDPASNLSLELKKVELENTYNQSTPTSQYSLASHDA